MRCPACRAENTEPVCRRCRADLAPLFALEGERRRVLAQARAMLGRSPAAQSLAQAAHQLRAGSDSARLLALAALLRRDFAAALAYHRQAAAPPTR